MNNLFAQSRSHWVRYDRYEIKTGKDGKRYITPEKAAKPDIYNPLKESSEMVLEALNVGMLMMNRRSEDVVEKAILAFVTHYGLLGLMTALPTTPSFMDYEAVYLPKNHFIKEESMATEDYLALFYPFDKLDVVKKGVESSWNVSGDNMMIALTMTFMEEPMAKNMSFQREYAEPYDWVAQQFKDWAFTLTTSVLYYNDYDSIDEDTRNLYRKAMAAFGGIAPTYHIELLEKPTIYWDFHSLLLGIQMMFSFMLVDDAKPLRLCKHCQKVFLSSRSNSAFCSPRCKNQYNVYKSRGRIRDRRVRKMIDRWIAEATECDFKVALEVKKPKSWLKSVSAFANGIGGTLFFGIDDGRNVIGLSDAQTDAETISRLIKERITPYPSFVLAPERENGKDILVLSVSAGRSTPYYYKADGIMEAYIRMGNESVIAPSYVLNQLILKGMHRTYDELISEYDFKDYAFSKLRERYKAWTGNSMEEKLFDSFDMRDENGKLTNAGALLADDSPIRHSRLFCTHWNGLDKSGGMVDALDSAEYSGSLIILLNEGVSFVKRNMKTRWKKTADSRIEMPDYCERSVFEALVNALIHRDYLILGSEVHIDIYDDRLTIYSPGGMPDGTRIQERDLSSISSTRRNPILADIFGRLGYMERQGSGFKKITETYRAAHNYRDELEPKFYSDASSFQVTLYNLNYGTVATASKVTIEDENIAIEVAIDRLNASQGTIAKAKAVFANMGVDGVFGRSDIATITKDSVTAAGNLITKLKNADLIEPVSGSGKGKYKFVAPKE